METKPEQAACHTRLLWDWYRPDCAKPRFSLLILITCRLELLRRKMQLSEERVQTRITRYKQCRKMRHMVRSNDSDIA